MAVSDGYPSSGTEKHLLGIIWGATSITSFVLAIRVIVKSSMRQFGRDDLIMVFADVTNLTASKLSRVGS
jgi:hypothetical protein